ncbi:MAG TPA: TRAP transporter large permease subunit, partial [SAR324 cluster bacterium]|nr:TRAP transporter large permease subunit [SAR324 cluster bacterium]
MSESDVRGSSGFKTRGYRSARESRVTAPELLKAIQDSLWAMLIPIGIIGGIRFGIFTPTEAGAICVLTVVVALCFSVPYLGLQLAASGKLFNVLS